MATLAVDELLALHAEPLRRFLAARCRDAELAAELLQEVAARLVAAAPRLDADGNPRGYLFRVAANVWRDHLRREIVRRRTLDGVRDGAHAAPPAADERVLERDLTAAVRQAVATLPVAQREVVTLRHGAGLTFREIAERLGRPLGTVLTQMRAALAKIGAVLEAYR